METPLSLRRRVLGTRIKRIFDRFPTQKVGNFRGIMGCGASAAAASAVSPTRVHPEEQRLGPASGTAQRAPAERLAPPIPDHDVGPTKLAPCNHAKDKGEFV